MPQENTLEKYLGTQLDDFNIIKIDSIKKQSKYYISPKDFLFFGQTIKHLNIKTDSNDTIIEFEMILDKVISSKFYNKLTDYYGFPTEIIKLESIIKRENFDHTEFYGETSIYESSPSSFNEKPFKIEWGKLEFKINITIDYKENATLITMKKNIHK